MPLIVRVLLVWTTASVVVGPIIGCLFAAGSGKTMRTDTQRVSVAGTATQDLISA